MPTIIVQADTPGAASAAVTLNERVVPAEAHSEHYLRQLIERVGWALQDAEGLEVSGTSGQQRRPPGQVQNDLTR